MVLVLVMDVLPDENLLDPNYRDLANDLMNHNELLIETDKKVCILAEQVPELANMVTGLRVELVPLIHQINTKLTKLEQELDK